MICKPLVPNSCYGKFLVLPADMFNEFDNKQCLDETFVTNLKEQINKLNPVSVSRHGKSPIFVHPDLQHCTHVFLRIERQQPSLSQPYTLHRTSQSAPTIWKTITIELKDRKTTVSLDRVKPAFLLNDDAYLLPTNSNVSEKSASTNLGKAVKPTFSDSKPITTKSGRKVHFPDRLTYS